MNNDNSTPPAPLSRGEENRGRNRGRNATSVLKFGGTSMGDAGAITQSAEISAAVVGPKAVVVSATSGTTDQLIGLTNAVLGGEDWEALLCGLIEKHEKIVADLGVSLDLSSYWSELRKLIQGISLVEEVSLSARDRVMTFGERVSSNIMAALLNKMGVKAVAVDAFECVFTDNNFGEGNVDFKKSNAVIAEKIGALIADGMVPVVTGFVGQSANGQYITLGRGGSDYTGAILAAALDAGELQIWTDVDGIFSTDPRLVKEACVLPRLSFYEAGELAFFGAKVLHPKTIKPAIEKNIPVKILNTFNREAPGTVITNEEEESVKSVTYRKNVSIINVVSAGMLEAKGFLARLFEVFARHGVAVDVVSTSEVSVSVTVDNGVDGGLVEDLEKFANVSVQNGMAIVCLVGAGIKSNTDILGKLFSAIADYEVSMVSQGASKRNITFLVKEAEAPAIVEKVFMAMLKKPETTTK